jgi:hypothetical protein
MIKPIILLIGLWHIAELDAIALTGGLRTTCDVGELEKGIGELCTNAKVSPKCDEYCKRKFGGHLIAAQCTHERPNQKGRECICRLKCCVQGCWGDPHCTTCDGTKFGYQGLKKYYVLKPMQQFPTFPYFEIRQLNRLYGKGPMAVLDVLEFYIRGWNLTFHLASPKTHDGAILRVNGHPHKIPYHYSKLDDHREQYARVVLSKSKKQIIVKTSFGVRIIINVNKRMSFTGFAVDTPRHPELKGHMGGILGGWDGNPRNDGIGPHGRKYPLDIKFSWKFGNSWIVHKAKGHKKNKPKKPKKPKKSKDPKKPKKPKKPKDPKKPKKPKDKNKPKKDKDPNKPKKPKKPKTPGAKPGPTQPGHLVPPKPNPVPKPPPVQPQGPVAPRPPVPAPAPAAPPVAPGPEGSSEDDDDSNSSSSEESGESGEGSGSGESDSAEDSAEILSQSQSQTQIVEFEGKADKLVKAEAEAMCAGLLNRPSLKQCVEATGRKLPLHYNCVLDLLFCENAQERKEFIEDLIENFEETCHRRDKKKGHRSSSSSASNSVESEEGPDGQKIPKKPKKPTTKPKEEAVGLAA